MKVSEKGVSALFRLEVQVVVDPTQIPYFQALWAALQIENTNCTRHQFFPFIVFLCVQISNEGLSPSPQTAERQQAAPLSCLPASRARSGRGCVHTRPKAAEL